MSHQGSLKLRLTVDIALLCLSLAVPSVLAPISRSRGIMLIAFATFLVSVAFLFDGIRTWGRLRKSGST